MTTLAEGCCSAHASPCSWQRANPSTICGTCRAASPSVTAWLAEQEMAARGRADDCRPSSDQEHWHRAQAAAYEAAHAYAVVRPDRTVAPSPKDVATAIKSARLVPGNCVALTLEGGMHIVQSLDAPTRLGDPTRLPMVPDIADADLAYLAGLAISSKDAPLARIAAALLLAQ